MRIALGAAATATLLSGSQLMPAPARADKELRDVGYLARVDGFVEGGQVTFRISDTETSTEPLSGGGFGPAPIFEAHGSLTDLTRAGLRVVIPAPYSANVHCEITVDGTPIARIDRFVAPPEGEGGPAGGVVTCGAPLPDATAAS